MSVVREISLSGGFCTSNHFTRHDHGFCGDFLCMCQGVDFSDGLDTSFDDAQVFVVVNVDTCVLDMPGKKEWESAVCGYF